MLGFGISLGATRLMRQLLFSVTPSDTATYVVATAVILGTAVAACLVPSRRALETDPAGVFGAG